MTNPSREQLSVTESEYIEDENIQKLIKYCVRIYSDFLTILHDNEHDTLTGLLNRKTFDAKVAEVLFNFPLDSD